jgi:hypothetical protein
MSIFEPAKPDPEPGSAKPDPEPSFITSDRQRWDYAAKALRAMGDWCDQSAAGASSIEAKVAFSQASRRAHDAADSEWARSRR